MQFLTKSFLAVTLFSFTVFAADPSAPTEDAPMVLPGLHNFFEVNDHVFRGAQPSGQGFAQLAKLGVKTIVDLRESGGRADREKQEVEAEGMRYFSFPLSGYGAPADSAMAKLLALLDDQTSGPVFVHCRRGADRTGTVMACYRIVHDHWENAKALAEAKAFHMSWTERAMEAYIQHFKAPASATTAAAR